MGADEFERLSRSPERTEAMAAALGAAMRGGEVIAIDGELGAGKTRFVRGLAAGLGADPSEVSSPTFVIVQRHRGARLDLVHADAYRLRSALELDGTGWSEWASSPGVVAAIEWASRVAGALPDRAIHVQLELDDAGDPSHRRIRVRDPDTERRRRLEAAIDAASDPAGPVGPGAPSIPVNDRCPICGVALPPDAPHRPFCSPRCRTVDLGRWCEGRYRVSRPLAPDDLEDR